MWRPVRLTSMLMALMAAACASPPDLPAADLDPGVAHGERIARAYCSGCHAVGRTGFSQHPDAPAFRTLSRLYPVDSLAESLVEGMMTGHPDMPEFEFTAEAAADFIAYLESVQAK